MRTSAWRLVAYAMIIIVGALTAVPNLLPSEQLKGLPDWLPRKQVTLGLDLRGGMHLVLEVDGKALIEERLLSLTREAREALRAAQIGTEAVEREGDGIRVALRDGAQRGDARRLLEGLAAAPGELAVTSAAPDVLRVALSAEGVQARIDAATEQSVEIVRRRIDETGLADPALQRTWRDRIVVQLPGVSDRKAGEEILRKTAKLTFHMVRDVDPAGGPRPGIRILPGANAGERYAVDEDALLSGERLSDARLGTDETTGPLVRNALDACDRAAALTRQLLAFGRKQIADTRVVRVADVVQDMASMLRALLGETIAGRGQRLAVRTDRQVPDLILVAPRKSPHLLAAERLDQRIPTLPPSHTKRKGYIGRIWRNPIFMRE